MGALQATEGIGQISPNQPDLEISIRGELKTPGKRPPPFVMFDRYFTNVNASYVTTNSSAASKKLVQHLIDMGHRLIAHIGGPQSNAFAKGILPGYRRALQKNKITVDEDLIVTVAMHG